MGARFYHPKSAQWMTQDPIGESDGPNLYAYVHNSPTRCVDRFGLCFELIAPKWADQIRNTSTTIRSLGYSSHAQDQMQNRGILPSIVENTIQNGKMMIGKNPGTIAYYESVNKATVIINKATGNIVTTS